ncbi:glycosyltransferase family 2 protein [Lutibacter citreus]|uniref:glycosyltransferase family 2 protein n=1 Tax=Lutibacter citreus TaxID=2138210 RepID=UPI000DBE5F04|nr:glycosyltransferase [Lutibacter citreus]
MLSVLIPIYNYNVVKLVETIHAQFEGLLVDFEVICICDASNRYITENKFVNSFLNTNLITLSTNIGRSKIRNLLVEKSNFNWLLFLDADVIPKEDLFISNYLNFIKKNNTKVCFGGIEYKEVDEIENKPLRLVYGKKREEISAERRKKSPYQFATGTNVLIHKTIFNSIKFNENIVKYGFEDVLFVENLKLNRIKIDHINNPVFHLGIENNLTFLNKTKEGIENLLYLSNNAIIKGDNLKLLKSFRILSSVKLNWIIKGLFYIFKKPIERNLLSNFPSLFLFDLYKLGYLCSVPKAE